MHTSFLSRLASSALLLVSGSVSAQEPKLESCKPVSGRSGVEGCWILASKPLGRLKTGAVFWTLDVYPDRDQAQAAAGESGMVLEALGKIWLFEVSGEPVTSSGGKRMAQIGPLPIKPNEEYTAQYREAIMRPGAVSRTHVHSGPEAFYTEDGETCLETPLGKQISRPGHSVIVPEGQPMELRATGPELRRGLVLVLHSSSKPDTTVVADWQATGLCKSQR